MRDRATKQAAVESYIQALTPLLRIWIAVVDGGFTHESPDTLSPCGQTHEKSRVWPSGVTPRITQVVAGQERHWASPPPTIVQVVAAAALAREARQNNRMLRLVSYDGRADERCTER